MDAKLDIAAHWFAQLQQELCAALEAVDAEAPLNESAEQTAAAAAAARFEITPWQRGQTQGVKNQGGGRMALLRGGRLLEKAGVHISDVYGALPENLAAQIPDAKPDMPFRACGISVIVHTRNPHAPSAHMNTRHISTGERFWFGGGGDLTPMLAAYRDPAHEDARDFHAAFEQACAAFGQIDYDELKAWCARYFFLPHRNEERGIGGIFYDYLNSGDWDKDFAFTKKVGETFMDIYPRLLRRRMMTSWSDEDRRAQAIQRGRYAEFNLLYDRGTQFGLRSGGNVEAILSSLPPHVIWD